MLQKYISEQRAEVNTGILSHEGHVPERHPHGKDEVSAAVSPLCSSRCRPMQSRYARMCLWQSAARRAVRNRIFLPASGISQVSIQRRTRARGSLVRWMYFMRKQGMTENRRAQGGFLELSITVDTAGSYAAGLANSFSNKSPGGLPARPLKSGQASLSPCSNRTRECDVCLFA